MLSAWNDQYAQPESRVDRVHRTVVAGDEDASERHGRLRRAHAAARKTERPFQRQLRHVARASGPRPPPSETARCSCLPIHSTRLSSRDRRAADWTVQRFAIFAVPVPSTSRNGRRATNSVRSRFCLSGIDDGVHCHRSGGDRLIDALGWQRVQRREWGSGAPADVHAFRAMTVRATGLKQLCAGGRTERESSSASASLLRRRLCARSSVAAEHEERQSTRRRPDAFAHRLIVPRCLGERVAIWEELRQRGMSAGSCW